MTATYRPIDFQQIAASFERGGHWVIHSDFAEPIYLAKQFAEHASLFAGDYLHTLMPMAAPPYAEPDIANILNVQSFFPGGGLRKAVNAGLVKSERCVLSDIPRFFSSGDITANIVMLQVSEPNDQGKVSLGVSVDYMPEVLAQNPIVIAQINPQMPFTLGDSIIDLADIDYAVEFDEPIVEFPRGAADDVDQAIAKHVASLLNDGDVLQVGIGALPDAVLSQLGHLKNLGAHTGILTGAWMPLIESGAVNNRLKSRDAGVIVTTMAGGDRAFYDFLDNNESITFRRCSYTHDPDLLESINQLCAINSVLQIDLTGNANAESVNGRIISTPGGLPDFASGASKSTGGKSIIAMRSSFKKGEISNIIFALDDKAPITLTCQKIDYLVTEYGVAELSNTNADKRAAALIEVAHPNHRESLARAWSDKVTA